MSAKTEKLVEQGFDLIVRNATLVVFAYFPQLKSIALWFFHFVTPWIVVKGENLAECELEFSGYSISSVRR